MAEKLKIPTEVVDSDWRDDIDLSFQLYGGNENDESKYYGGPAPKDAELIKKKEVENTTASAAKRRKIGHIALFSQSDQLAA